LILEIYSSLRTQVLIMGGGGSKPEEWILESGAGFLELIAPELAPGVGNPTYADITRGSYETIVVPLLDISVAYHVRFSKSSTCIVHK
jgi:hypothetical protein